VAHTGNVIKLSNPLNFQLRKEALIPVVGDSTGVIFGVFCFFWAKSEASDKKKSKKCSSLRRISDGRESDIQ
jgi:hypothetical protein